MGNGGGNGGAGNIGDSMGPDAWGGVSESGTPGETGPEYGGQAANEFGGMNAEEATAGLPGISSPEGQGMYGGMQANIGEPGTSPANPQDLDIPPYEIPPMYDQIQKDWDTENKAMQVVSTLFSAVPFLGTMLSLANMAANEAHKGGQVGSNVSDAMGLGSEPGGLGGPGGGGQGGGDVQTAAMPQSKAETGSVANPTVRPETDYGAEDYKGRRYSLLTGGRGVMGRPSLKKRTLLGV